MTTSLLNAVKDIHSKACPSGVLNIGAFVNVGNKHIKKKKIRKATSIQENQGRIHLQHVRTAVAFSRWNFFTFFKLQNNKLVIVRLLLGVADTYDVK